MASTVKVSDSNVVIHSDEEMLAEWQAAATAVIGLGKEYVIFGSRKVVSTDADTILKQISYYENRVLRKRGATGKNIADFSGNAGVNQW